MKKLLLSGYYGFGNLGDEAILLNLVEKLKEMEPAMDIAVLSNDPPGTSRALGGLKAYPRWPLRAVLKPLKETACLVTGGGSLLQDVTGWKSIPYYLGLTALARHYGGQTVLLAVGIGPINSRWQRILTKKLVEKIDYITVRDKASLNLLRELGVRKEIRLFPDPVFSLEPPPLKESKDTRKPYIVIAPRFSGQEDSNLPLWLSIIESLKETYAYEIVLWPLYKAVDLPNCLALKEKTTGLEIWEELELSETLIFLQGAQMLVGVRYHSLLLASLVGCPLVGISYDPKVSSLLKQLKVPYELTMEELNVADLLEATAALVEDLAGEKERLLAVVAKIKEDLHNNYDRLARFLRGV